MSATLTVYVMTRHMDRMRRFYEAAFGVKAGAQEGNWAPFKVGGATLALHAAFDESAGEIGRYNISFGVNDVDAAVQRFADAGGSVLRGVADETFGRMATLQDKDGRSFDVVQYE